MREVKDSYCLNCRTERFKREMGFVIKGKKKYPRCIFCLNKANKFKGSRR